MPWQTKTVTREELYSLVWERPVQHVADSIGGSDVGLGKTFRPSRHPSPQSRLLDPRSRKTRTQTIAA
jgi:hypothetical protein